MKRIIYEPAIDEQIPDVQSTLTYILPVAGVTVYDLIVEDDFTTSGTIHYDSTIISDAVYSDGEDPILITPRVIAQELDESPIHHFSGWEF